ncbi:MAG: SMP-30/gluconolactonase/LRE family protein [Flavisolibacter sp.]
MEVVSESFSLLGESPVWDEYSQTFYWVDILNGMIHRYHIQTKEQETISVHQPVGSVCLTRSGRMIAALQNGIHFVGADGRLELMVDPEANIPNNRFNDGKCDATGRLWAGTMSMNGEVKAGSLYCLETKKNVSKKLSGISVSNGLAWSPDNSLFYFIDTPTQSVQAFEFDLSSGQLSNGRVAINIPEEMGKPDGMTIDEEGMLWIALWGGGKITRWDPRSGKLLHQIQLPVSQVSSCTFGGPQLTDLYVTTARVGLDEKSLKEEPLAGFVFMLRDCGKGLPAATFDDRPRL